MKTLVGKIHCEHSGRFASTLDFGMTAVAELVVLAEMIYSEYFADTGCFQRFAENGLEAVVAVAPS